MKIRVIRVLSLFFCLCTYSVWAEDTPEIRIATVELVGCSLDEVSVREALDLREGGALDEARIRAGMDRVLRFYEERGYPFAAVALSRVALEGDRARLGFEITEGPGVTIGALEVRGHEITKPAVILRELRIRPGERYDQRRIDRGMRHLARLSFLERVHPPQLRYDPDKEEVALIVEVVEAQAHRANAVVGYVPGVGATEGFFTGLVDVSLGNLSGTGRKVQARWERRDPQASGIFLGYEEPWAFGFPVNAGGAFGQKQRTGYTETTASCFLNFPITERFTGRLSLGWEQAIPDSAGSWVMPRSASWVGGLTLEYDGTDGWENPTRGMRLSSSADVSLKQNRATEHFLPSETGVDQRRYGLNVEYFRSLRRRQVFFIGLHSAAVDSPERVLPLSEKLWLGGAHSLRGYREEQFGGIRIGWTNVEYRLLLGPESRAFLFLDGGYVFDRTREAGGSETIEVETFKVGYGFGVRVRSRMGIIGMDYGLGKGDGWMEGKVHVGVENRF
ncbi:MAG: BamA/TamA family outer membrane protein [Candidatus Latescibacteria bacterium]|nr:BamA/TamA family outer membrane protein [Candidatus Latescibacterota bacterium]